MPIDFSILEKMGSTNARLKQVFTAMLPDTVRMSEMSEEDRVKCHADCATRKRFEERIRTRLQEHIRDGLANYQLYAAADLAWDCPPINKQTLPLVMYAQGKINLQRAVTSLQATGGGADQYFEKDTTGKITGLNLPRFMDTNINMVRHFVTRRVAAQSNKYSNLWPFYKFEPRSTGEVGKLRADVLSQRVDIMVDQFGTRQHDVQVIRDMFLYGHSVDFPRASWEVERQLRYKAATQPGEEEKEMESVVVKEGVGWVSPHPSRVFYDKSFPLSSINTNSGCKYIGFWDVRPYRDLLDNPLYFNINQVGIGAALWGFYGLHASYFGNYYTTIKPPQGAVSQEIDPSGANDLKNNSGFYAATMRDSSVFVTEYYEEITPKEHGIGDYPCPVWVRFTVASDSTIIFSEFMPSLPATYCAYNDNDSRHLNISFAHEVMPYQDAMTNLVSQMLLMVEGELLKIITLDTDVVVDKQMRDDIRAKLKGNGYSVRPIIIELSGSRMKDNGIDVDQAIKIHETRIGQSLTSIFEAMTRLVALVEKLTSMSPAEMGQPAPREISATEVNAISQTTSSVYSFISDGVDSWREAKKRVHYESLVCCAESDVRVPVINRYTKAVIAKAGFTPVPDEEEEHSDPNRRRNTVIGSRRSLVHEYIFSSRDGAERATDTAAANTMVQLLTSLIQVPTLLQAMGRERLYNIINEIFRLSGTGADLILELNPGEDDSLGGDPVAQLTEQVTQLAQHVQGDAQAINELQQALQKQAQASAAKPPSVSLSYKDAPEDVKRQIEQQIGVQPSQIPVTPEPVE